MNKFMGIGRWTKDIDLKYLNDGTAVAKSTIAIDEGYGDKKKTHFFNVTMWKKTAEAVANYSGKGKKIAVEGRLQQRTWEKDGVKQYAVEIVAEQVEFMEPKEGSQNTHRQEPQSQIDDSYAPPVDDSDLPF
jgi:single-strand DNA-binding protein